ncbi:MAG: NADH-quinone oxidoreductase subunit NuoG [Pseudomonadota bacterium]
MSDDLITLEVDGKPVQARKGQMLIEVTDAARAYVPRFCYHEKLSVAANCRMCLVQVEKAPKPLPACATPVAEGMVVSTKSRYAVDAQKSTMEFLLINHPLDCPICDQGGECELQDLAMGYGRDVSRYSQTKRVVKDKNIGPLVSTDMTRCIHCTRCVRFGQEVQGLQQLGTTGRGEQMQIGTYIEQNVDHELSGNIIDLCPVGALNNKPYRYSARAWEMLQQPLIGAHDCVGSNVFAHTLRGTIKRIVPRPNDAINETWLSDRDRFAYEGIYAEDRLQRPRIKVNDSWQETDWETALQRAAQIFKQAGDKTNVLVNPQATLEEGWLLQRLAEGLGSANIDHRLHRTDTEQQSLEPVFPFLGMPINQLDTLDGALIVGSALRHEAPILAHRLRKAAVNNSAAVTFIDTQLNEYHFEHRSISGPLVAQLLAVTQAAAALTDASLERAMLDALPVIDVMPEHQAVAQALLDANRGLILLGVAAASHERFGELRWIATQLANLTGVTIGYLSAGPNAAGLSLAGVLPHRGSAGHPRSEVGASANTIATSPSGATLLWQVEPETDLGAHEGAGDALAKVPVVACTSYRSEALASVADVMLPIGTYAETDGTYINVEGLAQSWQAAARLVADAREGWKVLTRLGQALNLTGFDDTESSALTAESLAAIDLSTPDNRDYAPSALRRVNGEDTSDPLYRTPIYEVDALVRRARALQMTTAGEQGRTHRSKDTS